MLPSILDAVSRKGRKNAAIARDIERTPQTVTAWFSGRIIIPKRVRHALCEAIGAPVDWEAYEAEFVAAQDARQSRSAAPAHAPDAETPAKPPETPAKPPETPAQPARRLTAKPPTEKPSSPPAARFAPLSAFQPKPASAKPKPAKPETDSFWQFS